MQELQANAIATILIGPFVDKGDGVTPEEGVTLAAADSAEVMKHDGTTFVDIAGAGANQATLTHKEKGMYTLAIPAAVISDEGRMTVFISDESVCLPVWKDFMVLAQAAWISKYTAKDTGYMDVDIKAIAGTATPNTSGKLHVLNGDGAAITAAGPTNTQLNTAIALCAQVADGWDAALATILDNFSATRIGYLDELDFGLTEALSAISVYVDCLPAALGDIVTQTEAHVVDAVWDEALTGATHNIATSAGKRLRQAGIDVLLIREDTCQAGASASTVIIDSGSSGTNNFYDHMAIILTGGTGAGQIRSMHNYVAATFTADVEPDWLTTPDATSTYTIIAIGSVHVHEISVDGLAQINAEVDGALNTAVPGSPTAHSINERIKTIDDHDLVTKIPGVVTAVGPTKAQMDTAHDLLATVAKQDVIDGIADDIKAVTVKLDDTFEDDAGTYRFTENALEEGPSGTGGDATATNQATIITALGVIQTDLDDPNQYKSTEHTQL